MHSPRKQRFLTANFKVISKSQSNYTVSKNEKLIYLGNSPSSQSIQGFVNFTIDRLFLLLIVFIYNEKHTHPMIFKHLPITT
ncbi:hypothetical protein BA891_10020 [Vibrio natriegens]|nr:hypothetical protein BA891_10020 [Vibrio natriegens]